jgi:hypothetical protein
MSAEVAGLVLVALGVVLALFGDKEVDPKGGTISKLFSMPPTNAKAVKWALALGMIAFGVLLVLGVNVQ